MKKLKPVSLLLVVGMLVLLLAACGSGNNGAESGAGEPNAAASETNQEANAEQAGTGDADSNAASDADDAQGIDWEARKAANQEAGEINFMTSFQYSASVANVNAWVADEMGFFEELGLDVNVQPGLDGDGMKFLAAGQLQMAHAGSGSVLVQAVSNGAEIKGVSVMAPVGLGAIMVMEDSDIHEVKDLEGKTVGYKGAMSANYLAMFEAGGADVSKINQVSVGFDPTILNTGDVDAITVFKSNEPAAMERQGFEVRLLDPESYGIEGSFGVMVANGDFAAEHPTAVEDFLRAIMKAHEWILANPEETIEILQKRAEGNFDFDVETNRLMVETGLAKEAQYEGHGLGYFTPEQWQFEIDMLKDGGVITTDVTVDDVADDAYISAIYDGDQLIWPE
ncbi:ABC transporter substrate-binding protein [Paenibacillus sp. IB182496]|uniref:Thiamine pyrimidine synthase n=1 Tax=Paenibacillus sabuli TaxID=2772509 RepID=A0A927BNV0_9BACL|nr:ABC transporter substrate-binding protein [Paenibacillus sabuli]MBD2843987.1 ABC transporter substrate-binding protein [Paenibacillus sabuli]